LEDIDTAIAIDPHIIKPSMRKYYEEKYKEDIEALNWLNESVKIEPQNYKLYFERGLLKLKLKKFRSAIYDFNKSLKIDDNCSENCLIARAEAKYSLKQYRAAIKDYTIFIKLDTFTNKEFAHIKRGLASFFIKNYSNAILDFDTALDIANNDNNFFSPARIRPELTEISYTVKLQYNEIEYHASLYDTHYFRALAKYYNNDFDEAIKDFDEAIHAIPKDPNAYYYKGLSKIKMHNFISAIEDLNMAIELNPIMALAYRARGLANLYMGYEANAKEDFKKAIRFYKIFVKKDIK